MSKEENKNIAMSRLFDMLNYQYVILGLYLIFVVMLSNNYMETKTFIDNCLSVYSQMTSIKLLSVDMIFSLIIISVIGFWLSYSFDWVYAGFTIIIYKLKKYNWGKQVYNTFYEEIAILKDFYDSNSKLDILEKDNFREKYLEYEIDYFIIFLKIKYYNIYTDFIKNVKLMQFAKYFNNYYYYCLYVY